MKIIGLKVLKQKIVSNKKGDILKFLSKRDFFFKKFGETYFTEIKKNKIKGWNYHKKNRCIIAVPFGKVCFWFIDGRKKSPSYYNEEKITIGKNNYKIILVPPKIWFSFKSFTKISIVANCIDRPHSDNETLKSSNVKNYEIDSCF
tara:strand:+ start:338 stop:775 length:438 start_codon:yes stop_codon:yes gene_type:complete